eukprot:13330769-Heterocapsa_arctica.AAC.1
MIASPAHEAGLWRDIEQVIKFSEPRPPVDRYLGAHYNIGRWKDASGKDCVRFEVDMRKFCGSACKAFTED